MGQYALHFAHAWNYSRGLITSSVLGLSGSPTGDGSLQEHETVLLQMI